MLIAILVIAILSGRLLAPHITRVFTLAPSRLDKVLNPIERGIYRLISVNPARGMGLKEYFLAALIVNTFQMAIAFVIFSFQGVLPLNPKGFQVSHGTWRSCRSSASAPTPTYNTTVAKGTVFHCRTAPRRHQAFLDFLISAR